MNQKNKLRFAIIAELFIAIVMIICFVYETEHIFQIFELFLAIMSICFAFERHTDLMALGDGDESP